MPLSTLPLRFVSPAVHNNRAHIRPNMSPTDSQPKASPPSPSSASTRSPIRLAQDTLQDTITLTRLFFETLVSPIFDPSSWIYGTTASAGSFSSGSSGNGGSRLGGGGGGWFGGGSSNGRGGPSGGGSGGGRRLGTIAGLNGSGSKCSFSLFPCFPLYDVGHPATVSAVIRPACLLSCLTSSVNFISGFR